MSDEHCTYRQLRELINQLPENELDEPLAIHSGSTDTLTDYSVRLMDDDECKEYNEDMGERFIPHLIISTEN